MIKLKLNPEIETRNDSLEFMLKPGTITPGSNVTVVMIEEDRYIKAYSGTFLKSQGGMVQMRNLCCVTSSADGTVNVSDMFPYLDLNAKRVHHIVCYVNEVLREIEGARL